jgi:hypothetical protein
MVVAEKGEAELLGARGEIPYQLVPGTRYQFADLQGPGGAFATIDYGDKSPALYLGEEATLDALGISVQAPPQEQTVKKVAASKLECPSCRGSLDLVAPDRSERVGCPYCGALCDVTEGHLQFLQLLDKSRFPDPPLPLGSAGTFEGYKMTVCGYMVRSSSYGGYDYFWSEYLMYHPRVGFRWLLENGGHWSYVEPLNVADCSVAYSSASYDGKSYRAFDDTTAVVEYVAGEFYWRVEAGERTRVADYMRPPCALSREQTANEIHWSLSTYVEASELEAKFGVELPKPEPETVPLNMPYAQKSVYKVFGALLLAALLFYGYNNTRNTRTEVYREAIAFEPTPGAEAQVVFSEPFSLKGGRNIEIEAYAPVSNSWAYFQFDLVNKETGRVVSLDLPVEYYYGPDWSEGSNRERRYLKAQPAGEYMLRTSLERKDKARPMTVQVRLRQGVLRMRYFLFLLGFLALIPLFVFLHHRNFERKRWSESGFGPPLWVGSSEED